MNGKYIILEIIPTSTDPVRGDVIQLSALKLNGLELVDRFDYRINEEYVPLTEMLDMISYDKDKFIYKETTKEIMDDFSKWIDDHELLILNNSYTLNYLKHIPNLKRDIATYLNLSYTDDIVDIIINKYHLEPSDYIVDLLYEALIYETK